MSAHQETLRKTSGLITGFTDMAYPTGVLLAGLVDHPEGMKNLTSRNVDRYLGDFSFSSCTVLPTRRSIQLSAQLALKCSTSEPLLVIILTSPVPVNPVSITSADADHTEWVCTLLSYYEVLRRRDHSSLGGMCFEISVRPGVLVSICIDSPFSLAAFQFYSVAGTHVDDGLWRKVKIDGGPRGHLDNVPGIYPEQVSPIEWLLRG